MKRNIYIIVFCFVGSILIVSILFFMVNIKSGDKGGFLRMLPSHKLLGVNNKDIKSKTLYFGGIINSKIMLGDKHNSTRLMIIDTGLISMSHIQLPNSSKISLYPDSYISVDSPYISLMDGLSPTILRYKTSNFSENKIFHPNFFNAGVPLTNNSFALRYVNGKGQNIIGKKSISSDSLINTCLLEKQIDGFFCTDGEIVKVPESSKIIYVYYYRNQFLYADSNLNLLYKGKSIDTNRLAKIKVTKVNSTGEITMSAPPLLVNRHACASSKYLFIQSALRANNETEDMTKDVSMIDIYAIEDGKYQFSFYLPDFRGHKVRDFKVYGQSLYALYDHYLYKYQLNF